MILNTSVLVNLYPQRLDLNRSVLDGSGIIQYQTILSNNIRLITYVLPEGGYIFHYISNEKYNEKPDLFLKEFQEIDNVNLKRHTLKRLSNRVGSNVVA